MYLSVPTTTDAQEDFKRGGGPSFDMEVLPGGSVFADPIPGVAPHGVLVGWENLSTSQQEAFREVHHELTSAAHKLKELLRQVGNRVEDF